LRLKKTYAAYSSREKFPFHPNGTEIPSECIAGDIMRGVKQPADCPFFGKGCSPERPKGAPMVSSEGVCAAYYKYRKI
ncbi:MAG TPA: hydrogenase formation protein HypD, partial [Parabacteroides goldsteinii]|nr:hydrogenase formation protein HypD [Parabacteroides goldsteinii]